MRVIFPDLRLRHRRALHVEVKLAPAAVENESVAGVPTRVARELPIAVRRRGEECERVLGVRGVPDLARQVEARVVEDEAAAWLGARVDLESCSGWRWLKWLNRGVISAIVSLSLSRSIDLNETITADGELIGYNIDGYIRFNSKLLSLRGMVPTKGEACGSRLILRLAFVVGRCDS
nr:hypothetical protein DVH24_006737 [Ipomoea batatas]